MEYVYFIKHKDIYPIKIGRTNDLRQRLTSFNNASPFGIEVIGVIETKDSLELERNLHKRFSHLRLNGEWFSVDKKLIEDIITLYKGRDYINAKNIFELSLIKSENYSEKIDLSNVFSKEYNKERGFVNDYVLTQRDMLALLKVSRDEIKNYCDSIGLEYKTHSFKGKVKKGYKIYLKNNFDLYN